MNWYRLILEVLTLAILSVCYFKRKRMGEVILRLRGKKIYLKVSLIIVGCISIGDLAYNLFLPGLSLPVIVDKARDVLFCTMLLYCFVYTNRITDKGVVLNDSLREWHNIRYWDWSGKNFDTLRLAVLKQYKNKDRQESINLEFRVNHSQKESIDRVLKQYIP